MAWPKLHGSDSQGIKVRHSELPYSGFASTVPDNQGFLVQAVQMTTNSNTRWKLVSTMPQQQNITPYNFSLSHIDYVELDLGKYLTSQIWLLSATHREHQQSGDRCGGHVAPKAILRSRSRHIILAERPLCSLKIIHAFLLFRSRQSQKPSNINS